MSISKVNKTNFTIIRKSDFTKEKTESPIQVEISNKESKLESKSFNDLVLESKRKKQKKKQENNQKPAKNQQQPKNEENKEECLPITDFFI